MSFCLEFMVCISYLSQLMEIRHSLECLFARVLLVLLASIMVHVIIIGWNWSNVTHFLRNLSNPYKELKN